ncbi:MAG: (Na+)-NQR maturation NqrM [Marinobacterium sp.]|nr:(Na+)-NQR maturation NqrM [Marinobacterium sp.]
MFMTLAILALVILGMSVGVLMGGKPIAGSCGGMAKLGMDTECTICGGNPQLCEEEQERKTTESASAVSGAADKFDLASEVKAKS